MTGAGVETGRYALDAGARTLMSGLGITRADVLRRAALPANLFERGPTTITCRQYFALWTALEEEVGDPNLPIAIGRAISAEVFDPPVFAALCSPNLTVAARRVATYKKLICPMRVSVVEADAGTTVTYEWPPGTTPPLVLAATELVSWVALTRIGTRSEVRPLRVTMPEPPPDDDAYREYLGVPVVEGPTRSVTFSTVDATRPFRTAHEGMWTFFGPELHRRLCELGNGTSVAGRVRSALLGLLPAGDPTTTAVARELGMSTRTLQRRLGAEGTTFQGVLNTVRERLARHYLSESGLSIGAISFLLGYRDQGSFYRAFSSWTGQTPERVRFGVG